MHLNVSPLKRRANKKKCMTKVRAAWHHENAHRESRSTKDSEQKITKQNHEINNMIIEASSSRDIPIKKWKSMFAWKSDLHTNLQYNGTTSLLILSSLFFSSFLRSPLSRHLLIVSSSKRALSSTIITSVTTTASWDSVPVMFAAKMPPSPPFSSISSLEPPEIAATHSKTTTKIWNKFLFS